MCSGWFEIGTFPNPVNISLHTESKRDSFNDNLSNITSKVNGSRLFLSPMKLLKVFRVPFKARLIKCLIGSKLQGVPKIVKMYY